eukprot:6188566-Pleurochrysis_carterae.AAC.2
MPSEHNGAATTVSICSYLQVCVTRFEALAGIDRIYMPLSMTKLAGEESIQIVTASRFAPARAPNDAQAPHQSSRTAQLTTPCLYRTHGHSPAAIKINAYSLCGLYVAARLASRVMLLTRAAWLRLAMLCCDVVVGLCCDAGRPRRPYYVPSALR